MSTRARVNETLDYAFFVKLFGLLYERCANHSHKQVAFKLHIGLDHDGLIPAFIAVTASKVSSREVSFSKRQCYVTRMNDQAKLTVTAKHQVPENCAVLSDETA